jgi:hypothetical protein
MTDTSSRVLGNALRECLISPNEADRNLEPANMVDGMFAIARAIHGLAVAVDSLGFKSLVTPSDCRMGAIELLAKEIRDGLGSIASAVGSE